MYRLHRRALPQDSSAHLYLTSFNSLYMPYLVAILYFTPTHIHAHPHAHAHTKLTLVVLIIMNDNV